jgi:hypothetical protein
MGCGQRVGSRSLAQPLNLTLTRVLETLKWALDRSGCLFGVTV